jgi:hypothetical protein
VYVGMPPQSMYMYTESCTVYCACVSLLLYHRTSTRSTSTVLRALVCSRAIRRIVRDIIF